MIEENKETHFDVSSEMIRKAIYRDVWIQLCRAKQSTSTDMTLNDDDKSRVKKDTSLNVCADCGPTSQDVKHLFVWPAHPRTLIP